jgi:hypothetical protein
MNQIFTFTAAVYTTNPHQCELVALQTTGSMETRARRRVLQNMHDSGLKVRKLDLVGCKPAKDLK